MLRAAKLTSRRVVVGRGQAINPVEMRRAEVNSKLGTRVRSAEPKIVAIKLYWNFKVLF